MNGKRAGSLGIVVTHHVEIKNSIAIRFYDRGVNHCAWTRIGLRAINFFKDSCRRFLVNKNIKNVDFVRGKHLHSLLNVGYFRLLNLLLERWSSSAISINDQLVGAVSTIAFLIIVKSLDHKVLDDVFSLDAGFTFLGIFGRVFVEVFV